MSASSAAAPTSTIPRKNCTCNNCHEPFSRRELDSHFLCEACRTIPGVSGYRDPSKRGLDSGSPAYWKNTESQLNIVRDDDEAPVVTAPTESKSTQPEPATEFGKWRANVFQSSLLDDDVKLLLVRQAMSADFLTGGNCFESQSKLGAALGVTVYEIRRRQAIAIEKGWIRLLPMVVGFRRTSSLIQFLRPADAEAGPWEGPVIFTKRQGGKLAKSFKLP